jgi:ABC-2 type transport system permease protein
MIRDASFIARKDLQYMLRAKETLLWVFIMPVIFFYFIGTITAGFGARPGAKEVVALRTGAEPGFLADQVAHRLEEQGFKVARPESDEALARYTRRVVIPDRFTESILAGRKVKVRFIRTGEGLGNDYDRLRVQRAVYTVLADIAVGSETAGGPTPESLAALDAMPRTLKLEVSPAGRRKEIPVGFEQAIPGMMVMFTLLVMTTSGAILLVLERNQGLLRRLASTPIERRSVVLGKWAGKMALGIVQIAFAMLAGTLLFRMHWGPNLPMVLLVMLAYGALMASLGLILGSLASTPAQAIGIGVISANVLAALGGCWWPIEITPAWMQKLALFLPTGWAMDALHKMISFAASPVTVLPHLIGMTAAALTLGVFAIKSFRYH